MKETVRKHILGALGVAVYMTESVMCDREGAVTLKAGHKMSNKANRPTMRPRWAVWRLIVVTMVAMMVVMLEGGGRGGYGVDCGSSRCDGGN